MKTAQSLPPQNPHARAHRLERARLLVGVIDRFAVENQIDPLLSADRVVTELLSRFTVETWARLGDAAGLKSIPGPDTRAIVRQTYLDRARLSGERQKTTYRLRAVK